LYLVFLNICHVENLAVHILAYLTIEADLDELL